MNPRPLLVRFGAMGDMVILTVIIRALHVRFGRRVDLLASGRWTRPLLEGQPGVGNILLTPSRWRPWLPSRELRRLVSALRERGTGPAWICERKEKRVIRLLTRAGWREEFMCRCINDCPRLPDEHFADRWLRFAACTPAALGASAPSPPLGTAPFSQLIVSPERRAECDRWLASAGLTDRPLLLMQAGNQRTMRRGARDRPTNTKYWPEANWAKVLRGLRDLHPEHALVMLGVPREAPLNDDILALARVRDAHNLARDTTIPRLLALAERAEGLISVDTGPAHAAAAVGCPVVTLFGTNDPALYAPRGPGTPVRCLTGVRNGEPSMLGIEPDAVVRAWRRIVEEKGSMPPPVRDG